MITDKNPNDCPEQRPTPADEIQNALIFDVSQELRTLLTVLIGYINLLCKGALTAEQQKVIAILIEHTRQIKKIVARINTLLSTREHQSVKQPFDLATILRQMAETFYTQAAEAGVTFKLELPAHLPAAFGDDQQIQLALECLIEDCLKATPAGGYIAVQLGAEADCLNLTICHTAMGSKPAKIAYLAEPFQQAGGFPIYPYEDGSLGLTLTQSIVTAQAGKIEMENIPGLGSCFIIKLPITDGAGERFSSDSKGPRKKRILIVDDEEAVTYTLYEGLAKLPHCEIMATQSGYQALKLFAENPFDLLVTDYKMPDMDGIRLASQIRQKYPGTAIILMTAHNGDLSQESTLPSIIQRVLNKPVKLAEIRSVALETLAMYEDHKASIAAPA